MKISCIRACGTGQQLPRNLHIILVSPCQCIPRQVSFYIGTDYMCIVWIGPYHNLDYSAINKITTYHAYTLFIHAVYCVSPLTRICQVSWTSAGLTLYMVKLPSP